MTAERWMKFYPSDWRGDAALHSCSLAARGLWMEMLCLMDEGSPRGHLKLGRKKLDPQTLAGLVNAPPRRVEKLLAELEKAGVFSATRHGTIYSRKMVRESKWRANGKNAARKRWAQVAESKDEIEKRIRGSMTPESRIQNKQESCTSRLDTARAGRQGHGSTAKRDHPARDPPDFSKEPVQVSEALMRTRIVKH